MRKLTVIILISSFAAGAWAQPEPPAGPEGGAPENGNGERFRRNLERWKNMTPGHREELRRRLQQWKNMSEEERRRVRENYRRFRKMKEEQQEPVLRAKRVMAVLQDSTRRELHRRMRRIRKLPPERRRHLFGRMETVRRLLQEDYHRLREIPPHSPQAPRAVRQLRRRGAMLHHLPPQQLEELRKLTPEERRKAIDGLMEEWKPEPPPEGTRPGRRVPRDREGRPARAGRRDRLSPEDRRKLEDLPPEEREEAIRKLLEERRQGRRNGPGRPPPRPGARGRPGRPQPVEAQEQPQPSSP